MFVTQKLCCAEVFIILLIAALGQILMVAFSMICLLSSANDPCEPAQSGCTYTDNLPWRNLPFKEQYRRLNQHTTPMVGCVKPPTRTHHPFKGVGDVWCSCLPLSGISGLSFDSLFLSPLSFFCLVLFLSCHFSANGPFSWYGLQDLWHVYVIFLHVYTQGGPWFIVSSAGL